MSVGLGMSLGVLLGFLRYRIHWVMSFFFVVAG